MRASDARFCALCLLLGCAQVDVIATPLRAGTAGSAGSAGMGADAGSQPTYAYRTHNIITGGKPAILNALVASGLTHAVCACDGFSTSLGLDTDAFDGDLGPYDMGQAGGDVGVNQELSIGTSSSLSGSLVAAGSSGVSLGSTLELRVSADVEIGGPLAGAATLIVGGDARVADRIELTALTVKGTLTQPAGATLHVAGSADIGAMRSAPVQIANPCDCDATALLDVGAATDQAIGKARALPASAAVLDVRCGEYALGSYDPAGLHRSEERRVGKECSELCRSRWSPYH